MISPKMARVNVIVARCRALLSATEGCDPRTLAMVIRVKAKRDLARAERRQRHLRKLEKW